MTHQELSRHDFVRLVTATLGGLMAGILGLPALGYLISPALDRPENTSWIELGLLESYPVGVPVPVNFTRSFRSGWEKTVLSYGVFVMRLRQDQVRVFSNVCTHLGCRVRWHPDLQHYVSPCHDGHFDILGAVVSGPPPRPLDEFLTLVEGGILVIQFPPLRRTN